MDLAINTRASQSALSIIIIIIRIDRFANDGIHLQYLLIQRILG
jgi:hypothetical protein